MPLTTDPEMLTLAVMSSRHSTKLMVVFNLASDPLTRKAS